MTPAEELAEAQTLYAEYVLAERAVLTGKSYTIGGRQLSREDLSEIREGRKEWKAILDRVESGRTGPRIQRVVPRDL